MARKEGVEEVVIGLTYSVSEVHTHAYYAERAAALAECAEMDRLYLKDPGGLLTPPAVRELAPHFSPRGRRAPGRAAQPLHDRARALRLHGGAARRLPRPAHRGRAAGPRHVQSGGRDDASRPRGRGLLATALDPDALAAVSELLRASSPARRGCRSGAPQEFDATYYHHQLAGGMVSTTRRMLDELRRPELFDAVLEEVGRVRAEMGYPIIVTPVSQLVATQAVRNVIDGERWSNVSDETVRYFLGHYGDPAAPVAAGRGRAGALAPARRGAARARAAAPRGGARALRRRISDEELLLRLTMPEEQVTRCRLGVRCRRARPAGPARARPARDAPAGVEQRKSITYLRVQKGDDLVVWRRAT